MTGSRVPPNRHDALAKIAKSSIFGNLGLFIGSGFSKAVLDVDKEIALSWGELLKRAAEKLEVDYEQIAGSGFSYPEIASKICQKHADSQSELTYEEATSKLKQEISQLTAWYPEKENQEKFGGYLAALSPAWIVTTNYDLVIETLLTGQSIPLGPNEPLVSRKGIVPVFHLHGRRFNPDEIIITQEDYVQIFRPNDYRQSKLALMFKESTTVFFGYSLGDINVLTAIDWSNNVFKKGTEEAACDVIQVARKESARDEPYWDKNGILIVETESLDEFFKELIDVLGGEEEVENRTQTEVKEIAKTLESGDSSIINQFIDDGETRRKILATLSNWPEDFISSFISLFEKCIDETWNRAKPPGAFNAYNQQLKMILDIIDCFTVDKMPPALLKACAYNLDRVAFFVGERLGDSWAAAQTWKKRRDQIQPLMLEELKNIGLTHRYYRLKGLLETPTTQEESDVEVQF